ncbi:unnamed protein product, partial [Ilex paraguariensis]
MLYCISYMPFLLLVKKTCARCLSWEWTITVFTGITDAGVAVIGSGLSFLQSLDVSDCRKLTDKGLSALVEGCRDLRTLHVSACRFVTDELLRALSKYCHKLEELSLQGCANITDAGLTVLVDGCQRIKHLDVNKCSKVGDVGISSVSKACSSSLITLKLLDCYKVGDESILSLAKYCRNIETLIIGGCQAISNDSVKSLAAACYQSLKRLRMDWCLNVSDSSLNSILSQCSNLELLDIGCCEKVTDAAFEGLDRMGFELKLKILKVSNCPQITVAGIGQLLDSCYSLEYFDLRSCPRVTKAECDEAGLQFPECCK